MDFLETKRRRRRNSRYTCKYPTYLGFKTLKIDCLNVIIVILTREKGGMGLPGVRTWHQLNFFASNWLQIELNIGENPICRQQPIITCEMYRHFWRKGTLERLG